MKAEDYFPSPEAEEISSRWVGTLDRKRRWEGGYGRSALLVLDMQRYFMDPSCRAFLPASLTALERLKRVLDLFEGPVIFTRHIDSDDVWDLMKVWWRNTISGGPSEIFPELDTSGGQILEKTRYSAFMGTGLGELLEANGVETVVISGVMTDLCCETTARDAFMRGFKVVFLADCTATENETRHLATLNVISRAFGEVLTSTEYLSR